MITTTHSHTRGNYPGFQKAGMLLLLLFYPLAAMASPYSGFFFYWLEIPVLIFSLIFLFLCFTTPSVGVILSAFLIIGNLFILIWASKSGYLHNSAGLLLISAPIQIVSLIVAVKKSRAANKPDPAT